MPEHIWKGTIWVKDDTLDKVKAMGVEITGLAPRAEQSTKPGITAYTCRMADEVLTELDHHWATVAIWSLE